MLKSQSHVVLLLLGLQIVNALELVDVQSTVWTTLGESAELECVADSLFQWCYWENIEQGRKYFISNKKESQEDDGAIVLSSMNHTSCKLTIHLNGQKELSEKYVGDWKCHLANTDDITSSVKAEAIVALHLASPTDVSFYIKYNDEMNDTTIAARHVIRLSSSSEEVLEKEKILSSNQSIFSVNESPYKYEPSYLPLIAGKEVTLNCGSKDPNAQPSPNLSLWLASPEEERLLSREVSAPPLTYIPTLEDNGMRFVCFSFQKNDFVEFEAVKRSSLPMYVMNIPTIISYPTNIQEMLKKDENDPVSFSLQFYSQPPPLSKHIIWTFNDMNIPLNQTLSFDYDGMTARSSDLLTLKSTKSSPLYQIDLYLSRDLLYDADNISLIASIGNRLGKANWSFHNMRESLAPLREVSWMSMSHVTTYLIIVFLILNLILIGIWCTCCCCCGAACRCCRCCLCPFLRKKQEPISKDKNNFYISLQSNEELHEDVKKGNSNDWSLLSPKSFTYEEEPSPPKPPLPPNSHWIKLNVRQLDDTQLTIPSQNNSELLFIDESPVSSQNSPNKQQIITETIQSVTPPPAYSPKPHLQSFPLPPTEIQEDIFIETETIEVRDQDTQTIRVALKKSSKRLQEENQSNSVETSPSNETSPDHAKKTFTLTKNYTLTGPTSYPVFLPESQNNIYHNYSGSVRDKSWVQKPEEDES